MIIDRINARFGEGQTDIVVIDTQAEAFDCELAGNEREKAKKPRPLSPLSGAPRRIGAVADEERP
jgi:hypothetical protein